MRATILAVAMAFFSMAAWAQVPSNPPEDTVEVPVEHHIPGSGFKVVEKPNAAFTFSFLVSTRYLNQMGLDDTYTDYQGNVRNIQKRNDLQFQKVMLYFKGWFVNPKLRYLTYVWTSNTSQGLGAQVVIGGNVQYEFSKYLDVGAGIGGLPTSRAMMGQFPLWVRQDARTMAEEFFRGSFTTGIWAQGEILPQFYYKTMLGNNLSQLGIDAGQMDNGFDTWATQLWITPGNYGRLASVGDYEYHEKLAGLLGAGYSRSNETKQSQPNSEDPENSQIRLADGSSIFNQGTFGDTLQVQAARYRMSSIFGGLKYKGFSLDGEYFFRWVDQFEANGPLPVNNLFDQGFTVSASAMVIQKYLQVYGSASYIDGEYGNPTEYIIGINWFPLKERYLRFNSEVIFANRSPVGYQSYPLQLGSSGTAFMLNLEIFY